MQMGVGWLVIGFCFFQQEVLRKVTPGVPPRWGLLVAKVAVTLGVGHSSVTSFGADAPTKRATQSLETTSLYDAMDLKQT